MFLRNMHCIRLLDTYGFDDFEFEYVLLTFFLELVMFPT